MKALVAASADPGDGGYVPWAHAGGMSGMAPACELVSLKVMRPSGQGTWVTSSSAVIRALTYLRTEVNTDPGVLRVHGVNMSLGCEWQPDQYAAGQSPLCQAVNQLIASGMIVVISAGNFGANTSSGNGGHLSGPRVDYRARPCPGQHRRRVDAPGRAARIRHHLDLGQGPDPGRPGQAGRGGPRRVDRVGSHR